MLVEVEPRDHLGYSNDYRPDVSVAGAGRSRSRLVGDVEFKDPLSSNPEDVGQRGAFVGLGNTEPGTSADVFGLEQRGAVGDGDFRPSDGGGYVAYKKADYAHALSRSDTGGWVKLVYARSPRMRRASWMSLGMMVTRLAWMAHRLVSSKRPTR